MSHWPILGPYPLMETLTLTAPLGLRFRDEATSKVIGDGLRVTAYPLPQPGQRIEATKSLSGVYGFSHLPGLRDFENGRGDDPFWRSAAAQAVHFFGIEVIDAERRFLPFRFELRAPQRGVYAGEDWFFDSLPGHIADVPLFSSPGRIPPAGMAVLRAELREPDGRAAAWALLEAHWESQLLARGVADEEGRVALFFRWPKPEINPLAALDSLGTRGVGLREQVWTIQLRAFYQRLNVVALLPEYPALPDLPAALKQGVTDLRRQPLTECALHYGEELSLNAVIT